MELLHDRCAALDIGKKDLKACVRAPNSGRRRSRRQVIRTFATTTNALLELRDWLIGEKVTLVVLEATGDYWRGAFYLLEDCLNVILVNAAHAKGLPGRKTDVRDAAWLCQMGECGLLKASFVPPEPIRHLRDLTRYRATLAVERTREAQRLEKELEDAPLTELATPWFMDVPRDLSTLVVPPVGSLAATGEVFEPYRLLDGDGALVVPVATFLRDLQACGRSPGTLRSYGMDLLHWFRFVWMVGVCWDRASSVEARDFCCWLQLIDKPIGTRRYRDQARLQVRRARRPGLGPNPVTGKPMPAVRYAPATVAHCETVLRGFYEFHLEAGSGPMVNPFPLARNRRGGRANAHHNPMDSFTPERSGRFRPRVRARVPRQIPDAMFDELFAQLGSDRDRALLAFWVSTGARASELLGATVADADPGQQLITVIRKGSRALQPLPASPDAFVWLRLYQARLAGLVPAGPDQPLWWTRRAPLRALTYHAARAMFTRANTALGSNWTLHDLRHIVPA